MDYIIMSPAALRSLAFLTREVGEVLIRENNDDGQTAYVDSDDDRARTGIDRFVVSSNGDAVIHLVNGDAPRYSRRALRDQEREIGEARENL